MKDLRGAASTLVRSEEHTSELQSRRDLVCRLLLEKKARFQRIGPIFRRNQLATRRQKTCPEDSRAILDIEVEKLTRRFFFKGLATRGDFHPFPTGGSSD